ncbi:hypothetical protein P3L10_029851 [Capsicum annuum]
MKASQATYTSKISETARIAKKVLEDLYRSEEVSKKGKQKVTEKCSWKLRLTKSPVRCLQLGGMIHQVIQMSLNKRKTFPVRQ